MILSLAALAIGYGIDLLLGDPRSIPHPVVLIGKLISALEKVLRKVLRHVFLHGVVLLQRPFLQRLRLQVTICHQF